MLRLDVLEEEIHDFVDCRLLCFGVDCELPKEIEVEGSMIKIFPAKWLIKPQRKLSPIWVTSYSLQPYKVATLMVEELGITFPDELAIPLSFYYQKTKWYVETNRLTIFVKVLFN